MQTIDVTGVEPDRVASFSGGIPILQEVVGHLRGSSHLAGSMETENEQIKDKAVVLEDESRKLKTADETKSIDMSHILVS